MQHVLCPNPKCSFRGRPSRTARGSFLIGLILLFLGLVPGVFYFFLKSGYRYHCPDCGIQLGADN